MKPFAPALAILIGAVLLAPAAFAQPPPESEALFALVIGVNRGVDRDLAPLRYADDDAARYFELFRSLGARTYLLADLDDNTRRLHSQAAGEALDPTAASLRQVVDQLSEDIRRARERGVKTVLYLVYAGHGNIRAGQGYLNLADARLTGTALRSEVLQRVESDRGHLIIDACHSYFLVFSRGPGGQRRSLEGFSRLRSQLGDMRIGLLLSTSSARESHEWEAFQAGVFSHEVRSGLHGAADSNGDGRVSYREIAAFVERANAAIPNERFRPQVFAKPPEEGDTLVDLGSFLGRRLRIDGQGSAHYFLENALGVRYVDFHSGPDRPTALLLPTTTGPVFLHRPGDGAEFEVSPTAERLDLAKLEPSPARVVARGAAHESFDALFRLPFDQAVVADYRFPPLEVDRSVEPARLRRWLGWGAVGLAAASAVVGAGLTISAWRIQDQTGPEESNQTAVQANRDIERRNIAAVSLYSLAGGATIAGLVLLLWPKEDIEAEFGPPVVILDPSGGSFGIGLQGRF